jgi:hypothetical protein
MVTAAELLDRARQSRVKPITVGDLELHVRRFSLAERIDIGSRARSSNPPAAHEYLVIGLCQPDASPYFTAEEAREFAEADGLLAEQIIGAILEHAGLSQAAQETAAKN